MIARITIDLEVRQWIEENDLTIEEAKSKIIEELNNESDEYEFGSFINSRINVSISKDETPKVLVVGANYLDGKGLNYALLEHFGTNGLHGIFIPAIRTVGKTSFVEEIQEQFKEMDPIKFTREYLSEPDIDVKLPHKEKHRKKRPFHK